MADFVPTIAIDPKLTAAAASAAYRLESWYQQLAAKEPWDRLVAYRIIGVVQPPATIFINDASKYISISPGTLAELQAAWKTATEFMQTPQTWPIWRVVDWRIAIPKLVSAVRQRIEDLKPGGALNPYRRTEPLVIAPPEPAKSGVGKGIAIAAALALAIKVLL